MKIFYENGVYNIITEYPETDIKISTTNIAEAKKFYIDYLMNIFDETVHKNSKKINSIYFNNHLRKVSQFYGHLL